MRPASGERRLMTLWNAWKSLLNRSGQQVHLVSQPLNCLIPRVKPLVTQSFLTFDSMDRTLKCDHSAESC